MKYIILACVFLVACSEKPSVKPTSIDPCEDMKAYVEKKIRDRGVSDFTLEFFDSHKEGKGRVVGTCDQGTKKLMYRRGK